MKSIVCIFPDYMKALPALLIALRANYHKAEFKAEDTLKNGGACVSATGPCKGADIFAAAFLAGFISNH